MLFGKKKEKEQRSVLEEEQMQSPFRTIIKNLLENKLAMGGLSYLYQFLQCASSFRSGFTRI